MLTDQKTRALELIANLVAFDTTPGKPTAPLIDFVEAFCGQHGVACNKKVLANGQHGVLVARIGPEAPGGVVLSGHVDVVSVVAQDWRTDPFTLYDDGARLYGRGACDMKGFIACVLAMIPVWQSRGLAHPFYLALSCDEEEANATVHDVISLLKHEKSPPTLAVIGEPTNMSVVAAHKGVLSYDVDIRGKAAHSSQPDMGLNALLVAHDIVTFVRQLDDELKQTTHDARFSPPYCTTNIGKIDGGTAANIVAGHCSLSWNMRQISNAQAADVRQRFMALLDDLRAVTYPGVVINCQETELIPLDRCGANPAITLAQRALGTATTETASMATEAGYYQQAGFSAVVCGPGSSEQAHTPDEYLAIDQVDACLDFLKALSA